MQTTALITAGVATVLSGLFSTLYFSLRDFSLRKLEEIAGRNGGIDKLRPIIDRREDHAMSVGLLRVLVNVALIINIVVLFGPLVPPELPGTTPQIDIAAAVWAYVVGALLLFLVSVLIPHSVADHLGERIIHRFAPLIRAISLVAYPLRPLRIVDVAVKRLAGEQSTEQEELEDELLSVVTEGEREGSLGEAERYMIEAVLAFGTTTVEEIMTPRTEIEGIELTDDLPTIVNFIKQAGHSRIPVYEGDLDHIAGVLYAKDLLAWIGHATDDFSLRSVLREALFIPESKLVSELMIELKAKKVHMAIVLDEYGGTTGLVTFEDILEEIVGEIQDEYEPAHEREPEILVDPERRAAEIDARASVYDANELLETIDIEIPEHEDYETVGGFVLNALGHIPVAGESFQRDGIAVTVLEAEPTRVGRLRIEALTPEPVRVEEARPPEAISEPLDDQDRQREAG